MSLSVSVVIPTYYRNERLRDAIESVRAQQLEQIELIVVDGTGEAHARPVISEYDDVLFLSQDTDQGPHAARSVGVEYAKGQYVQFLDDDDRLRPGKLAKQVSILENQERVGVAYCGVKHEGESVEYPDPRVSGDVLEHALAFTPTTWTTSTLLIDRDVLQQIMPLQNRHGADDIGMRIELARLTHFDYVNELLVIAGHTDDSLGRSWASIEGRKLVLQMYQELYDQHHLDVKKSALSELHRRKARRHLDEQLWSLSAILSFGRSIYYAPDPSIADVGEFVSSLAGRPGKKTASYSLRFYRTLNEYLTFRSDQR